MENIKVSDDYSLNVRVIDKKQYEIIAFTPNDTYVIHSGNGSINNIKGNNKSQSGYDFINELKTELDSYALKDHWGYKEKKADDKKLNSLRTKIIKRLLTSLEKLRQSKIEDMEHKDVVISLHDEDELNNKYSDLYKEFLKRSKEVGMTPLVFVSEVTHGLGVDLDIEVVRAWCSYVSTVSGEKGTNVIAIGTQASGKTKCLESALSMIPQERIIKGIKSEGFFYREYDGIDLTGYIFYLGDLGGDNDNRNTLEVRDVLKQLNTDGEVSRGVVDKDLENESQKVVGHPALSYSTVIESMINGQEASRSCIITPPTPNTQKLMIYKSMSKNQGEYKSVFERINEDCNLIQGYVWHIKNHISDYELFNPYMFCIEDHLKILDDFNRKIDEFNTILKLCCIMNNPKILNLEDGKLKLIIARKKDVVNAFRIFDTSGMLATEKILINGLIKEYDVYELEHGNLDNQFFEGAVKNELKNFHDSEQWDSKKNLKKFFTVRTLRSQHNRKYWYKKNREELDLKLEKLYQMGFLINIGKDGYDQIYGIHEKYNGQTVGDSLPSFNGNLIDKARDIFKLCYSSALNEYDSFIKFDRQKSLTYSDFENVSRSLYNLAWE